MATAKQDAPVPTQLAVTTAAILQVLLEMNARRLPQASALDVEDLLHQLTYVNKVKMGLQWQQQRQCWVWRRSSSG